MTIFVYITDDCRQHAHTYHLTAALDKLAADIEREQAFWRLDAFPYPFWVKKRLGNRHSRLVCRLETHYIHGQAHDVLVCLSIFQRGDKQYHKVYWQMIEEGEALYQRLVQPEALKLWLEQRCAQPTSSGLPVPSAEENLFLYAVRSCLPYRSMGSGQDTIYESWSWVDYGLPHCPPESLTDIAQELTVWTQTARPAAATLLAETPIHQVWLLSFPEHQVCLLTVEARHPQSDEPQLSERHIAKQVLEHAARTQTTADFQQLLARSARRVYPKLVLEDPKNWLAIQRNSVANLAFSPEESAILHFTQTEDRPFPVFINGRAGSGKSTILQYLFADYFNYAYQHTAHHTPPLLPAYFTCNQPLTDRAIDTIRHILPPTAPHQTSTVVALLKQSCLEFRGFLLKLLPAAQQATFSRDNWLDYGRFRRLWEQKFGRQADAVKQYPASLCWHVIRSCIKGLDADALLDVQDYQDLNDEQRAIDPTLYKEIYHKVWEKWYQPLCKKQGYWDDQDLARYVLTHDLATPTFPAIFCDESQDFTLIEVQIILRLNLFSARQLRPHDIQRVPLIFAGDQFQTLNPTGFRWQAIKAQVVEQFIFALDPAKHTTLSEINYRELSYNFRSTQSIAKFSNIIHGLRAKLFQLKSLKPQQSWHEHDNSRAVVLVDSQDHAISVQLAKQYDLVFVLPCLDGQETTFIQNEPVLRQYLQLRPDGSTSIPAMSVVRAKGLEFQRVVLYGFAADRPANFDVSGQTAITPEQQIHHEYFLNRLYVAVTRARSQLLIIDPPTGCQQFWQHFQHPWQPPLSLASLPNATDMWESQLGTLRNATLADITPDANQIRLMDENAQQLSKEGIDNHDVYLLRQAAGLYEQLDYPQQQQRCLAEVLFIEENYLEAGIAFQKINVVERAFHSFWRALQWEKLQELIQRQLLPHAQQHSLEAEATSLFFKANATLHSYIHLLRQLCHADAPLPSHSHDQGAWHALIHQLLSQLPLDKHDKKWPSLYEALQQLAQHSYFQLAVHPSVLAEVAYLAQAMTDACTWWEKSKEQYKITPPFPRYAEAVAVSRPFPNNLDALVSLQRHADIGQQFSEFSALDELHPRSFQLILDSLFSALPRQQIIDLFSRKLLNVHNLSLLDTLITHVDSSNYAPEWLRRLKKLRVLRACTEGDWALVIDTLHQEAEKPSPAAASAPVGLILYGLANSDAFSRMTQKDHTCPEAHAIMSELKKLFLQQHIKKTRDKKGHITNTVETHWQTDPANARLLGAMLERSHNFVDTLQFYESLEKVKSESRYAQLRWLACKMKQAEHAYALCEVYQNKLDLSTSSQERADYERKLHETEQKAQGYLNTAKRQKRLLNITSDDEIPACPDIPIIMEDMLKQILNIKNLPDTGVVDPLPPETIPHAHTATTVDPVSPSIVSSLPTTHALAVEMPVKSSLTSPLLPFGKSALAAIPTPFSDTTATPVTAFLPVTLKSNLTTAIVNNLDDIILSHTSTHTASTPPAPDEAVLPETLTPAAITTSAPDDSPEATATPAQDSAPDTTPAVTLAEPDHTVTPSESLENVIETTEDHHTTEEPPAVALTTAIDTQTAPVLNTAPLATHVLVAPIGPLPPPVLAPTTTPELDSSPTPLAATRLPTTTLYLFDYRLLIVRAQGRLNIEHQLTGESVSIWPNRQRLQGDWHGLNGQAHEAIHLQGTCLWLQFIANSHDCIVSIPEHGVSLRLSCG